MSNIKHLTIWEDSWGPRRLYDPERQTMCCMGMHCAADGVALDLMEEMSLPSEIGALLQHDMNEKVSAEHVEAVGGNDMTDKEDALAAVNDAYHGRGPVDYYLGSLPRPAQKKLLRRLFREMLGIRLTFRKGVHPILRDAQR